MYWSKDRNGRVPQVLAALAGIVLLAGCGVKSEPAFPDGASYPRTYPSGATPSTDTPEPRREPSAVSPVPATPGGAYEPPPAATDPNFR